MKLPAPPPDLSSITADAELMQQLFARSLGTEVEGRYLAWDEVRHRPPPEGLTPVQWWAALALARRIGSRPLPLVDVTGLPFHLVLTDEVHQLLHEVDRDLGGRIQLPQDLVTPEMRDRYVISSLIEEAITSSQLEGASTTRKVAKEMIRTGRPPATTSERMILNNYRAMERVAERSKEPLTPAFVLELHEILTEGTLSESEVGRPRRSDEAVHVVDDADGTVLHVPPPADSLPARLKEMCRFANGETPSYFVHPVVRAILLHLWLAYDHPFVDGNGRTARALFYWALSASGDYWLVRFLSISRILKKAPGQYGRAFLHTETDSNDATYFVIHQLRVIQQAVRELVTYLERKHRELREAEMQLRFDAELNHRQRALLAHALRHPAYRYSIAAHRRSHNVVYQTARADLLDLCKRGYLSQRRVGRQFVFVASSKLARRRRF